VIVTPVLPGVNTFERENASEILTAMLAAAETPMVHSSRHVLVCAMTATALFAGAACGEATPATTPATTAGTPAAPAASGAPGAFGGTDLAWVEITIAMNEQLLPLLALAPANSASPAARKLAADVKASTTAELADLGKLRDQAKLPTENPHEGMPMPGMVTPEQVAQAAKTKGAGFDSLLTLHLKGTFEQGVSLATSETKAGIEPQTLALAKQVLKTRGEYLPRVEALGAK
jgi:uncharacterized protein (DUF305 family)